MPIRNSDVADIVNKVADLLEIEGENEFRIRAYQDATCTAANMYSAPLDQVRSLPCETGS